MSPPSISLERIIDIEGFKDSGRMAFNIAGSIGGWFAITGRVNEDFSFVTVVNLKGKTLRNDTIRGEEGSASQPCRRCSSFSYNEIATLCTTAQVGVYDTRNGSLTKKNICNVISSWTDYDQYVISIASDRVSKTIFVGSMHRDEDLSSRDVLVFDDKLNYLHTMLLPEVVTGSADMTVQAGNKIIICDYIGRGAYLVSMEGEKSKLIRKLEEPTLDDGNWYPYRVCTDSDDVIYMLWATCMEGTERRLLIQYSPDGRQLLKTIELHSDSSGLCSAQADEGEKILVTTLRAGKVQIFKLG